MDRTSIFKYIKFSIEVFPFKNHDLLNNFFLYNKKLLIIPFFISLTFNSLGIEGNIDLIKFFIKKKIDIMPHISCINVKIQNFIKIINFYYLSNINKLLILRGDDNVEIEQQGDEKGNINKIYYSYNLIDLIRLIYKNYFRIYIATYCEFHNNSFNYKINYKNLYIKSNFNIKYIITQYFYNIDSYLYFFDDLKKIKSNFIIIPGIMPIYSINQLIKFSNLCKSDLPVWIIKRFNNFYLSNKEIKILSLDVIINLCFKLIKFNINNIHFYTMNNILFISNLFDKILISNNV